MSLPERWIERIFARLLVRYGAAWLRMWDGVSEDALKADWARELAGYAVNPKAIEHGLEHLPADKPPTVSQFKQLCRGAPAFQTKRLPAPCGDTALGREIAAKLKVKRASDTTESAHTLAVLLDRQTQGLPMTQYQRDALRELAARQCAASAAPLTSTAGGALEPAAS